MQLKVKLQATYRAVIALVFVLFLSLFFWCVFKQGNGTSKHDQKGQLYSQCRNISYIYILIFKYI